ncbi:conserved hypothetical protein [Candidatus Magnetomoraceae bacterium gMMP-15]
MSIQPEGEELRKAVKWISEMRIENPNESISKLVQDACLKFDISPKDTNFLRRRIAEENVD